VVHLRIVAPKEAADQALHLLCELDSVANVIHLPGAAAKPHGDVILCDVAREDASVIVSDLRELEIPKKGSIAMEMIDSQLSEGAEYAVRAAKGAPADAVIWEEVEAQTSEDTELSVSFLVFMVIAMLIASVGVILDSPILIIGAMVVGPEFGPLAGLCVALVEGRGPLARRSFLALAAGFPLGVAASVAFVGLLRLTSVAPGAFDSDESHPLTAFISNPDEFSVIVALCAGVVGVLSLTSTKSGALIGVLISVATIPSAAAMGVTAAYANWEDFGGAALQLAINLTAIVLAGAATLWLQRLFFIRRRKKHVMDPSRALAGLPIGRSRRGSIIVEAKDLEKSEPAPRG
jgi:uncharacterized hydrophobic protein (TIGR00271 family)